MLMLFYLHIASKNPFDYWLYISQPVRKKSLASHFLANKTKNKHQNAVIICPGLPLAAPSGATSLVCPFLTF